MARVTFKLNGMKKLANNQIVANRRFKQLLGKVVRSMVLESIAVGKSPVSKQGRYAGYAVDRKTAKLRQSARQLSKVGLKSIAKRERARLKKRQSAKSLYPNSVKDKFPRKQKRPVNLKLSGEMLRAIGWRPIKGGIEFGLTKGSKAVQDKFQSHNAGTNIKRNVPRRAIIPTFTGERFSAPIQARIRNLYLARISNLIKQINK